MTFAIGSGVQPPIEGAAPRTSGACSPDAERSHGTGGRSLLDFEPEPSAAREAGQRNCPAGARQRTIDRGS